MGLYLKRARSYMYMYAKLEGMADAIDSWQTQSANKLLRLTSSCSPRIFTYVCACNYTI